VGAPFRWLTPVGFAVIGLVVLAAGVGGVGFRTSGRGLEVTAAASAYAVVATIFLLRYRATRPTTIALLLLVAAAATAAVHHGDPNGPVVGLYLVMAFGPLRLDLRSAAAVAVASALGFDAELLADNPGRLVFVLAVDAGAFFFFLMGTLLRREHDHRAGADQLLAELERSRSAERAAAALAERSYLAREMHDILAHTLSGLVLQLNGAVLLARSEGARETATTVERAQGLAKDGLAEAKEVISTLRGDAMPGPEGLGNLLAGHCQAGGSCSLTVSGRSLELAADARLAIYRTAQEALNNVRKYAPGADVEVALTWADDGAVLVVQDSGPTGHVLVPAASSGYGIAGMSERAALLGGLLSAGPVEHGFRVELRVPAVRS
jgi:signal transduction histidine kinase